MWLNSRTIPNWQLLVAVASSPLMIALSTTPATAGPYLWYLFQDTVADSTKACASMGAEVLTKAQVSNVQKDNDAASGSTSASTVVIHCIRSGSRATASIMISSSSNEGKQLLDRLSKSLKAYIRFD
jgi:predicted protein tyrosine phosphatase